MELRIDDASGSIDVIVIVGDVTIDDGSGSIDVKNVANLKIHDGSGSIDVVTASGDVSIGDFVQAIISDQQEEIEHLEHYIHGQ